MRIKRVYCPANVHHIQSFAMRATSTARVVRFQARQKAGLIVVSVTIDQTKFARAREEAGLPLLSDRRDEIEAAAQQIIDAFCGDMK